LADLSIETDKQLSMPKLSKDEKWGLVAGLFLLFLAILQQINLAFPSMREFIPQSPKVCSVTVEISIYKKRKMDLTLLKTTYSGRAVKIFDTYYRDDSLFAMFNRYFDSTKLN
jgi:hypothetical protein